MKCPQCGAWNQAYLPRCTRCGAPLTDNTQTQASWEEAMHKKKPALTVVQFDPEDDSPAVPQPTAGGSVPAAAWKLLHAPALAMHVQA